MKNEESKNAKLDTGHTGNKHVNFLDTFFSAVSCVLCKFWAGVLFHAKMKMEDREAADLGAGFFAGCAVYRRCHWNRFCGNVLKRNVGFGGSLSKIMRFC